MKSERNETRGSSAPDHSSLEAGVGGSIPRYGLMHYLACFTLFDGDPGLVNTILGGFLDVTQEEVRAAAQKYLDPARRALVIRRPSKKGAAWDGCDD